MFASSFLFVGCVVNAKRPRGGPRKRWSNLAHDDVKNMKLPNRVRWYEACLERASSDARVFPAVLPSHGYIGWLVSCSYTPSFDDSVPRRVITTATYIHTLRW